MPKALVCVLFESTLRTTRPDLLFGTAVSESCVQSLMAFLLSALIEAPLALWKVIPGVIGLLSKGAVVPIPYLVCKGFDAVEFCR